MLVSEYSLFGVWLLRVAIIIFINLCAFFLENTCLTTLTCSSCWRLVRGRQRMKIEIPAPGTRRNTGGRTVMQHHRKGPKTTQVKFKVFYYDDFWDFLQDSNPLVYIQGLYVCMLPAEKEVCGSYVASWRCIESNRKLKITVQCSFTKFDLLILFNDTTNDNTIFVNIWFS